MFQTGDYVVYGIHGVCRVKGKEAQLVNRKRTEYLVLEPLGQADSRFYLPAASEASMEKLKPVLSEGELKALLDSDEIHTGEWITDENARKKYYRELIGSGDRVCLMKMVSSLYRYRKAQYAAGKKFHQCDENFLRDAERLLASEISLVLKQTLEEARDYLREVLQK